MMRVLFITNIPSPYRVDFFNELGKTVELTVLFEKSMSPKRDVSWRDYNFVNFQGIVLKGIKATASTALCFGVRKYLTKEWNCIIVADVSTPTGMLAIQTLKHRKIPYWIEGDGGFAKSGKGLKERIKKHFISGASGYFSTSGEHDKYYLTYGAEKERIHRYPFTSISKHYIERAQIPFDKERLKEKLGITESNVIVAVGQFIPRKGFDVLLNASANLPQDTGVYFIGGTPAEEYLQLADSLKLSNIHYIGFMPSDQLMDYYRVADVFALPTREDVWGLVINEAMAFSLPIVTTDRCIAGLELVRNGENGYVVPVENVEKLREALVSILKMNEKAREAFGARSKEIIEEYTIEKMAASHVDTLSSD